MTDRRARRHRLRSRAAAGLAVVAVVLPLSALPAEAAGTAVAPAGRVAAAPDDSCSTTTGTLINQTPPGLSQLGALAANTVATGKNIIVAVVDSGVQGNNPHFRGALLPGQDLTGSGIPNGQTDSLGHGTAVAGEIAARLISGSKVVGLAPDATILPIRVYTVEEDTPAVAGVKSVTPSVSGITAGIITAANDNATIINVSMSTPDPNVDLENAVRYATSRGALVVASAGNRKTSDNKTNDPRYPAAFPDALAVAAVDSNGVVTDDSIHGSYVDVAAPGVDILTTLGTGDCLLSIMDASTSFATAYVSAAAALIAQAHPDETPAQWRYRLEVTAQRLRPETRDDNAGWGIIQPYEALTFVSDGTAAGPQDPTSTTTATPAPVEQRVAPAVTRIPDTTARDQTLWLTLGGVVLVLVLALVALLRRDRKRPVTKPPRTPAGVR